MDTRYWGPSGWRLLHLIAASPNAAKNNTFWEMIPYILPCKFCRASLTEYYIQHPIPKKASQFPAWMYTIHNCVNDKLREQCKTTPPNPPEEEVIDYYENYYNQGCSRTIFPGWRFLFSIADNHPHSSPSKPMPDAPTTIPTSMEERNRYNLLTQVQRIACLEKFWKSVPDVLPFEEWTQSWKTHQGPMYKAVQHRKSALSWLWKIRCGLESDLEHLGETNFHGLCKEVAKYRSGCSTSKRAKTCRSIRSNRVNSVKGGSRKTRRYKQRE